MKCYICSNDADLFVEVARASGDSQSAPLCSECLRSMQVSAARQQLPISFKVIERVMTKEQAEEVLNWACPQHEGHIEWYIKESEHQDGEDYWNSFKNIDELIKDFQLYASVLEEGDL